VFRALAAERAPPDIDGVDAAWGTALTHRLVYASRALVQAHSPEMLDIVRCALRENPRFGITGALYFDDVQFFQVVEGPAEALDSLWGRLLGDRRHHDVVLLQRGPIERRQFGAWSMKFHDGAAGARPGVSFAYEALKNAGPARLDDKIDALRLI
jgi:hypothetical protein